MQTAEVRRKFLEFFKKKGHTYLPSSPVIPFEDPTLLFVNAGMNQFKEIFLGNHKSQWSRVCTAQKCVRVGGKHNDLENVGHTSRHLTFFEMLGNFSFGDYFKKDAIAMAFEFATEILQLDKKRIFASVLYNDDESHAYWEQYLPQEQICRMGEKDNFWSMGEVGPCGPSSELYFDRGEKFSAAKTPVEDIAGERFIEFWNLVFMQYNKDFSGQTLTLPKLSVDTGLGLERMMALLGNKESVFETDILRGLIAEVEVLSQKKYDSHNAEASAFRVIADHLRTLTFAITDGAEPSNLDRGYVLRKILRRALRYGKTLGFETPFLYRLVPSLVSLMQEAYPELSAAKNRVQEILEREEGNFYTTLKRGGSLMQKVVEEAKKHASHISGSDAFKLKDTYGLPLEEIVLFAKDSNLTVDIKRFEELEHEASLRSKSAQKKAHKEASSFYEKWMQQKTAATFEGYQNFCIDTVVTGMIHEGKEVTTLYPGQEAAVLLEKTCFYAEKGGQVGDQGSFTNPNMRFSVIDCQEPYPGAIVHIGILQEGTLHVGDSLEAKIDFQRRESIEKNHSATHLLHWALQKILGEHIKQAGSLVEEKRLRFDFYHHKALTAAEIETIEDLVNQKILENYPIMTYEKGYAEVRESKEIKQFFGDKYGEKVRVVDMEFSKELCGGTHSGSTAAIGMFRITKESSIAQGVRRIEAITGKEVFVSLKEDRALLNQLAEVANIEKKKLVEKFIEISKENQLLKKQVKEEQQKAMADIVRERMQHLEMLHSFRVLIVEEKFEPEKVRLFCEGVQIYAPIIFIILNFHKKGSFAISVSEEYLKRIDASQIFKVIQEPLAAKGGGKPHLIMGNFENKENQKLAIDKLRQWINTLG